MTRSAATARNDDDHAVTVFLDAVARALAEMDAQKLAGQREADGGAVDDAAKVESSTGDEEA